MRHKSPSAECTKAQVCWKPSNNLFNHNQEIFWMQWLFINTTITNPTGLLLQLEAYLKLKFSTFIFTSNLNIDSFVFEWGLLPWSQGPQTFSIFILCAVYIVHNRYKQETMLYTIYKT